MELLYLCNDKRKTNSFGVGFLTQGEAFGALISQASIYNSYVSEQLLLIIYKLISPFTCRDFSFLIWLIAQSTISFPV